MAVSYTIFIFVVLIHAKPSFSTCQGEFALSDHVNFELLPQYPNCGLGYLQPGVIKSRIVGGEYAALGEFPWMARLKILFKTVRRSCGGSLINDRYVISAAHCFLKRKDTLERVQVVLGDLFKNNTDDAPDSRDCVDGRCAPPPIITVASQIIMSSDFNFDSLYKDIALLRLQDKVNFNDFVKPICLPFPCVFQNETFDSTEMTLAGWGLITQNEDSDRLKKLSSTVIYRESCNSILKPYGYELWEFEQCFNVSRISSSCSGDSGGPVMLMTRASRKCRCRKKGKEYPLGATHYVHYLMAINSNSLVRCFNTKAASYPPRIHCRVGPFLEWILNKIKV